MNKALWVVLVAALAAPAAAQEEYPYGDPAEAPEPDYGEPAPEYTEPPAYEEPPAYAEPAPEPQAELIPVGAQEEAPLPEVAEEEVGEPFPVYAGLDTVLSTLSASNLQGFAQNDFDSGMYRLRAGMPLVDKIGVELQIGFDSSGSGAGSAATDLYYGLFAVPNTRLFDTVDLAFPIGYAAASVAQGSASADLNSMAYGVNAELPLRVFDAGYPDLRFLAGWMVYYQKNDARLYGANLGVRYDFTTRGFSFAGLGDAFSGIGDWFSSLWPFGDEAEAEE